MKKTALLIIDLQNDLMPGGILSVPKSEEIIPMINHLMAHYPLVVATQNWYPKNHEVFASNHKGLIPFQEIPINRQRCRLLPDYCIAETKGADFPSELLQCYIATVFRKNIHAKIFGRSAFYEDHKHSTGLSNYLKAMEIKNIHIVGLAIDDYIYHTILDALDNNFTVTLIEPAVRVRDIARNRRQTTELLRQRKFILAHSIPFAKLALPA